MTIRLKFFAILRERAGVSEAKLDLPDGATVATATTEISKRFPSLADQLPRAAFAVNQSIAAASTILNNDDELAVLPPVSGGRE